MNKTRPSSKSSAPFAYRDWRLWLIDVFQRDSLLTYSEQEKILKPLLDYIDSELTTNEFQYLRVGFVVFHYGRRGTTISIWHWGKWGDTYETFVQSWYCYLNDFKNLELLGIEEPVASNLDLETISPELHRFKTIADEHEDSTEVCRRYCTN